MPKVSVIVPVYNTEKYLAQCVDSILSQSFTDFELLLINDGSKDNSGSICDQYAANDSRVKVFHKENGGVSSARNLGLENARGEWITFCDSDDWLNRNYLYSLISHSDADMVMASFNCVGKNEDWDTSISDRLFKKDEVKFFLDRYIHTVALCGSCCKLFNKKFIGSLRFKNNISSKEDTIFVFDYLSKINTVRTIESWEYQYRRGVNDSLSVRNLSLCQYRNIIKEYSKSFRSMEDIFCFQGKCARVASNSSMLNRCLHAIKEDNSLLLDKYKDFIALLHDEDVVEILTYKDERIKGRRRQLLDFCINMRMYPIVFAYVVLFNRYFIY